MPTGRVFAGCALSGFGLYENVVDLMLKFK